MSILLQIFGPLDINGELTQLVVVPVVLPGLNKTLTETKDSSEPVFEIGNIVTM